MSATTIGEYDITYAIVNQRYNVATSLAIALAAMLVICAPAAIRLRGVWAR